MQYIKTRRCHFRACGTRNTGFTILELALVLAILGMLAVGILVPFVAQVAQRNIASTEKILDEVKETLLGYATATGRLPCPATAASNGVEAFAAGGSAANGNCSTFYGFLPAVTLGYSRVDNQGFAIDAWGITQNRIRYAVSNQTVPAGNTNPFTKTNGMRTATPASMAATALLYVCASGTSSLVPATHCGPGAAGTGGSTTLTANAPVVIWSVGANAATGGTSTDEAQNPNPNGGSADRIFVSRTRTDTVGTEFDDIVTWISVGTLVSRMVLGGQLP